MKAIQFTQFGPPDVLHLTEIEKPTPKANEILVRIFATSINIGDLWARNFKDISPRKFSMPFLFWIPSRLYFGLSKPKINILGSEFAGEVEAVGQAVTRFKKGDQVFGYRGQSMGANAEYLCLPENGLVTLKPRTVSFEEAATIPYGALTALNLLRKANIQPGQNVLILGASGRIGSFALQLAKLYGAHVTSVCSTPRVGFVQALGADEVIDYTRTDFTKNGKRYDLIFDVMNRNSFERCRGSLTEKGIYLLASFKTRQVWQMLTSPKDGQRVICALSSESLADLEYVKELVEAGKLKTIVDKRFPLEKTAEAHRYMERGQRVGNVVIEVAG